MNLVADTDTADGELWWRCYERLQKIRAYEFDWNDEGANPPGLELTGLAEAVLHHLQANNQRPLDSCFATNEGHVIISWEAEQHYFELEVDAKLRCTARQLAKGASRAESWEISQSNMASLCVSVQP